MMKVFEAFAGYGSQSLSLENIGIEHEVVGICEIEPDAIIAYGALKTDLSKVDIGNTSIEEMRKILKAKNVGYDFAKGKSKIDRMKKDKLELLYKADMISNNLGDISIVNINDVPNMDYFTYSFPCQSISVSGKQEGIVRGETRSGLLYECERIIENKKPKYLLMENVKNLVSKKFKPVFDDWCEYLEGLGYKNYWQVLNAKDYGVPQNRERVFMVSILGEHEEYVFPEKQTLNIRLKDVLEETIEDKYYLSQEIQNRFKVTNTNVNIIGTTKPDFRTIGQRDLVYNPEGITGTLVATDYKQPKQIVDKPIRLGGCFDTENSKHQAGSVWDKECLAPTLYTMQGGYSQPLVIDEVKIEKIGELDCEGWYDIEKRVHSTEGLAVTVECKNRAKYIDDTNKIITLGNTNPSNHNATRVLSTEGLSCIVMENYGKGVQILDKINESINQGNDRIICEKRTDEGLRFFKDNISGTLRTIDSGGDKRVIEVDNTFKIRKLTPKECFRLMGLNDNEIDKIKYTGLSDSAMYKLSGNSIVKNVLDSIHKNMFINN